MRRRFDVNGDVKDAHLTNLRTSWVLAVSDRISDHGLKSLHVKRDLPVF